MSEIGGDRLDIHAVLQRKRGIGVSKLVEAENNAFSVEAENEICYNAGRLWNFMACFA